MCDVVLTPIKGIQANFEKYTKLLEEQMAEQRRKWEQELLQREVNILFQQKYHIH